jgi:hypothetical protein
MAKELPYFQFEPAEYLTKNISFCSLSAQGLFINICSYYWQRGCKITKEQVLKRLNYPNELDELIQEGIIDVKDDFIIIKFLDNQLNNVKSKKEDKSTKGSIGNLKRWHKDIYEMYDNQEITIDKALEIMNERVANQSLPDNKPIATLSLPDKKSIAKASLSIADKIREDNIIEDNIIVKKEKVKKESASTLDWDKFLAFFNQTFNKRVTVFDTSIKNKYSARLKSGYTKENIIDAMLTVSKDSFHVETNFKHIGLDFFARPDKLSKYSFKSEKKAVTNNYNGTL